MYCAGLPCVATCSVPLPEAGARFTVTENVYIVPQSSVGFTLARAAESERKLDVHSTRPPLVTVRQLFDASVSPSRNDVATTLAPAGSGTEKLSKPLLLTTRGSGPFSGGWITARAKSRFSTA